MAGRQCRVAGAGAGHTGEILADQPSGQAVPLCRRQYGTDFVTGQAARQLGVRACRQWFGTCFDAGFFRAGVLPV